MRSTWFGSVAALGIVLLASCAQIAGLDEQYTFDDAGAGGDATADATVDDAATDGGKTKRDAGSLLCEALSAGSCAECVVSATPPITATTADCSSVCTVANADYLNCIKSGGTKSVEDVNTCAQKHLGPTEQTSQALCANYCASAVGDSRCQP